MEPYQRRILIVDDNQVIRIALRSILRQAGFNVVGEGRDGEVVAELVERLQPDLGVRTVEAGGVEQGGVVHGLAVHG